MYKLELVLGRLSFTHLYICVCVYTHTYTICYTLVTFNIFLLNHFHKIAQCKKKPQIFLISRDKKRGKNF